MGEKGAKHTVDSAAAAEDIAERLEPLGTVTTKKMFGGNGIFCEDVMFTIVDSAGRSYFRVDDTTRDKYESAGSQAHGRMPYQSIPEAVMADDDALVSWGREALDVARTHKK